MSCLLKIKRWTLKHVFGCSIYCSPKFHRGAIKLLADSAPALYTPLVMFFFLRETYELIDVPIQQCSFCYT